METSDNFFLISPTIVIWTSTLEPFPQITQVIKCVWLNKGRWTSWCFHRSHLWRMYSESNMDMRKDGGGGMSSPSGALYVPAQSSCYKIALIVLLLLVTGLFVGLLIGESICFLAWLNCISVWFQWEQLLLLYSNVSASLLCAGEASFCGDGATEGAAVWSCSAGWELGFLHSADFSYEVSGLLIFLFFFYAQNVQLQMFQISHYHSLADKKCICWLISIPSLPWL